MRAAGPITPPAQEQRQTLPAKKGTDPLVVGTLLAAALVAGLTLLAHWPAIDAKATWLDDNQYLYENRLVRHPSWSSARRFLSEVSTPSSVGGYYQPLTMISLMLDVALGAHPQNLRPIHRTSVLLHAANAVLVLVLLRNILLRGTAFQAAELSPGGHPGKNRLNSGGSFSPEQQRDPPASPLSTRGTGMPALLGAMTGALIFGMHPLTVECTAWVAERKTLLATFFALWSLIAYVRFTATRGKAAYALCVTTFLLALLSKPTVTLLPIAMLLLDWWPLGRLRNADFEMWNAERPRNRSAFRIPHSTFLNNIYEKLPLFVLSGVFGAITIVSQGRTASLGTPGDYATGAVPVLLLHNIAFYPLKFFWPTGLAPYYTGPATLHWREPETLRGIIGTAIIAVSLMVSLRWTRGLVGSWLIWLALILPALGVIGFTGVIAADKYMYLPMLGFLLGIAWAIAWLLLHTKRQRPAASFVVLAAVILVLAAELRQTRITLRNWRDMESLYLATLAAQPRASAIYNNYANILYQSGRKQEARQQYLKAIQYDPRDEMAYANLGAQLSLEGHAREALPLFEQALALKPDYTDALLNLGNAYVLLNEYDAAKATFRRLIELHPELASGYHNLAAVLALEQQWPQVIPLERHALERQAGYLEAQLGLANALVAVGQRGEAIAMFEQAVRDNPDSDAAHLQLADALMADGRAFEAEIHYRAVLRLKPGSALAYNNLANAVAAQGREADAMAAAREAIRLDPEYANAHFNLGTLLLQASRPAEAIPELRRALELRKDFAKGHHYLGVAYEQTGNRSDALVEYREAALLDPQNPQIQSALADLLSRTEQNASRPATASSPAQ